MVSVLVHFPDSKGFVYVPCLCDCVTYAISHSGHTISCQLCTACQVSQDSGLTCKEGPASLAVPDNSALRMLATKGI